MDRFRNSDFRQTSNGLQTDFCFQTSDKLRILDFELHIYDFRQTFVQISNRLRTSDFGFWGLDFGFRRFSSRLQTLFSDLDFGLQTSVFGL